MTKGYLGKTVQKLLDMIIFYLYFIRYDLNESEAKCNILLAYIRLLMQIKND